MNYQEAMDFIHGTYQFGSKLGLENISNLLERLGNPQHELSVIHLAGTNGKGSTAAFLHSMLKAAGYRVGLYTSPYLESFNERMQINGNSISEDQLARFTGRVKEKIQEMVEEGRNHPTEFEVVTAIAFCYFAEEKVDYLVLEVGLGGRLDATNVIKNPLVSVITPLGYDHTQYLGNTLEEIAFEKGGIIKHNSLAVLHPQEEAPLNVLKNLCQERHTAYSVVDFQTLKVHHSTIEGQEFSVTILGQQYKDVKIAMLGHHQIHNCMTALWTVEVLKQQHQLKIQQSAIYEGLQAARWPGRFEVIKKSPLTIIDGAHNVHGAAALGKIISLLLKEYSLTLVIGMLADKDVEGYLKYILPLVDQIIVTEPNNPRAMKSCLLAEQVQKFNKPFEEVPRLSEAVKKAMEHKGSKEAVLVAGSLYLIGEARKMIREM